MNDEYTSNGFKYPAPTEEELYYVEVWIEDGWKALDEFTSLDEAEEYTEVLEDESATRIRIYNATRGMVEWES